MAFSPFKKIKNVADRVVSQLQDNIADALTPIVKNYRLDSRVITSQALIAGQDNIVSHGLGRRLLGWSLVRVRDQETIVWDKQDSNGAPERTLILWCASDCTVDLEVF